MISMLDQVRDLLEELGTDLGVTDPVSGESVVRLAAPKAAKKRAAKPRGAAKRAASKKPAGHKTAKRAKKSGAKRRR